MKINNLYDWCPCDHILIDGHHFHIIISILKIIVWGLSSLSRTSYSWLIILSQIYCLILTVYTAQLGWLIDCTTLFLSCFVYLYLFNLYSQHYWAENFNSVFYFPATVHMLDPQSNLVMPVSWSYSCVSDLSSWNINNIGVTICMHTW